jgi:hypothetical protein
LQNGRFAVPSFTAKVVSRVPCFLEAEVVVEADTREAAEAKIRKMYDEDELDFGDPEHDYDESRITEIIFDGDAAQEDDVDDDS